MKTLLAAALIVAANAAFAQGAPIVPGPAPSERWFSLNRTSAGYLAAGNLAGTFWAFHVRGETEVKILGDATFALAGAVIQVKPVPRRIFADTKGGVLEAHKRFEQKHQSETTKG